MKKTIVLLLSVLAAFTCHAQTNATLTIVTNPPEGGNVTGAGTYPSGADNYVNVNASYGWYISNISLSSGGRPLAFTAAVVAIILQGGDLTTITSLNFDQPISSDTTMTVDFGPLFPAFNSLPVSEAVVTGGTATLAGGAGGRQPISYQWQFNGTNIPKATAASLTLTNVQSSDAGSYTLIARNAYGTSNSLPALLTVQDFIISTNGEPVEDSAITVVGSTYVSMQSRFPNGSIFYTLDGSTPDFSSTPYGGTFYLSSNATVRAIAYSADFSESVYVGPLQITVVPVYGFSAYSPGGGTITVDPPANSFASNSVVSVVATPDPGFTFMGWLGDLSGNDPTNTVVMTGAKSIEALFGTTLAATAVGNGTVSFSPTFPLHPYGMAVELTAIPAPGSYFALWGNAASGIANPFSYFVTQPAQTVSALFAPLPANQAAFTVNSDGAGYVEELLATNKNVIGSTNLLLAIPDYGQQFLGWSGSIIGTENPLPITLNTNMAITAHFSRTPFVGVSKTDAGIMLSIQGVGGNVYEIDTSTNLSTWMELFSATNYMGETLMFSNSVDASLPYQFYRVVTKQ